MSNPGSPSTAIVNVSEETPSEKKCLERAVDRLERVVDRFAYKDKSKWFKDIRGGVSLTASIIATITFQSAINPPGGIVQASANEDVSCKNRTLNRPCAGQAVLAVANRRQYLRFLVCNTICFIASLSVCLLLVSGLPLNNASLTWLLSIGMCITITSLILAYLSGALMVTPANVWDTVGNDFDVVVFLWIGLLELVSLLLILRFIAWLVNKCLKKGNKSATPIRNEEI